MNRSAGALLLSLTVHVAAGAALAAYGVHALLDRPILQLAWGAGEGTSAVSIDPGTSQADTSVSLASSEMPAELPALVVEPTPLTDAQTDDASPVFGGTFSSDDFAASLSPAPVGNWIGLGPPPGGVIPSLRRSPPVSGGALSGGGEAETSAGPGDAPARYGDRTAAGAPSPASTNRPPRYPREALQRRWEGTVLLEVDVLEGGGVGDARVVESSGHDVLDRAALEAVLGWRFNASDGGPLTFAWKGTVPVEFVLKR